MIYDKKNPQQINEGDFKWKSFDMNYNNSNFYSRYCKRIKLFVGASYF